MEISSEGGSNSPRFSEMWKGYLSQEDILTVDRFGAAIRIMSIIRDAMARSAALASFLSRDDLEFRDDDPEEILGIVSDHIRELLQDSHYSGFDDREQTDPGITVVPASDIKNHVLLSKLPKNEQKGFLREARYWDIKLPADHEGLDPEAAHALYEGLQMIRNLPDEANELFPLNELDGYLLGHSLRVAVIAAILAKKLGNLPYTPAEFAFAGLCHDWGKLQRTIRSLTTKPGTLNSREFKCVKVHPSMGEAVIKRFHEKNFINFNGSRKRCAHHITLCHHLRRNGGYPNINFGEINVDEDGFDESAEVIAIADLFDAVTSGRRQKVNPSMPVYDPYKKAVAELCRCSGLPFNKNHTPYHKPEESFHPHLVKEFLSIGVRPVNKKAA